MIDDLGQVGRVIRRPCLHCVLPGQLTSCEHVLQEALSSGENFLVLQSSQTSSSRTRLQPAPRGARGRGAALQRAAGAGTLRIRGSRSQVRTWGVPRASVAAPRCCHARRRCPIGRRYRRMRPPLRRAAWRRCRPRLVLRGAWISRPAGLCGLLVLPRLGAFLPVRRAVLLLHERTSGFRVAPPVRRSLDLAIQPSHSSDPPDRRLDACELRQVRADHPLQARHATRAPGLHILGREHAELAKQRRVGDLPIALKQVGYRALHTRHQALVRLGAHQLPRP